MAGAARSVLVLYGSETGNAQDIAEELGRMCQRLRFESVVEELDAVELSTLLQHQLVVFVVSTTGQGDIPHNALLFWRKLLRKKLPPGCLDGLRYTYFGLGDSTYVKFNWAARKLVRRLEQLGAHTFLDGFEADEQFPDGIEGSFARWADGLRKHLIENHPHPDGYEPIPDDAMLPPKWSLEPALDKVGINDKNPRLVLNGHTETQDSSSWLVPVPHGWTATLVENRRMTPASHWQDVRLVAFDIPARHAGHPLRCNPGDCLTIYPTNTPDDAQKLIDLMDWTAVADQPLDLAACGPLPSALHTAPTSTLRDLLLHNIDLIAVPRRSFLRGIAHFSADADQRERLLELTQDEFLDEYFDYATRSRRTVLEVLEEFWSVKIPASRLLDVFPLIRGRDFSIANADGGVARDNTTRGDTARVELLVALVKYRTILRKPRQGLCSRYLANLPEHTSIRVTHKPVLSPIHGPLNAQRPLVAMATGTGVAPVRSLILERLTHPSSGPMLLFFGNRSRAADFFFEDEWAALRERGVEVLTAFSRDQPEKAYVQHVLRREAARLGEMVRQRTIFAVCGGSTKMADACKEAVFGPLTEKGGEDLKKLLADVTWWQEIW